MEPFGRGCSVKTWLTDDRERFIIASVVRTGLSASRDERLRSLDS
jgi:hypothetical protein